jgi:transposase
MGKTYRPYAHDQMLLLPINPKEWLPGGHLAYFIEETVAEINLDEILNYYERSDRGNPPYNLRMMVKVLFYAYSIGKPSSRKIAKAMREDIGFRWLGGGNFPDFRTLSDFRRIHLKALSRLFKQVLELCRRAGLLKLGVVALDGTKVKANASMAKNRTYQHLKREEDELEKEIEGWLKRAAQVDEEEDRIYGPDKQGNELPKGFQKRKDRLRKIRKAKEELEKELEEKKEEGERKLEERKRRESMRGKKLRGRKPKKPVQKNPKSNLTDSDSKLMHIQNGYLQGYDVQAAIDCDTKIILAAELTQGRNDVNQLNPMLKQVEHNIGERPRIATADAVSGVRITSRMPRKEPNSISRPPKTGKNQKQ